MTLKSKNIEINSYAKQLIASTKTRLSYVVRFDFKADNFRKFDPMSVP